MNHVKWNRFVFKGKVIVRYVENTEVRERRTRNEPIKCGVSKSTS